MIGFLFGLLVLTILLGVGFHITGAIFTVLFWICIKLPIAFLLWGIGLVFCCTILLIPIGMVCFRAGLGLMVPGRVI